LKKGAGGSGRTQRVLSPFGGGRGRKIRARNRAESERQAAGAGGRNMST